MSPLDNQVRSLRGGDVGAARALVRQWGIVESGLTALGAVAVLVFLWAATERCAYGLGSPRRFARADDIADALRFFTRLQRRRTGAKRAARH